MAFNPPPDDGSDNQDGLVEAFAAAYAYTVGAILSLADTFQSIVSKVHNDKFRVDSSKSHPAKDGHSRVSFYLIDPETGEESREESAALWVDEWSKFHPSSKSRIHYVTANYTESRGGIKINARTIRPIDDPTATPAAKPEKPTGPDLG